MATGFLKDHPPVLLRWRSKTSRPFVDGSAKASTEPTPFVANSAQNRPREDFGENRECRQFQNEEQSHSSSSLNSFDSLPLPLSNSGDTPRKWREILQKEQEYR